MTKHVEEFLLLAIAAFVLMAAFYMVDAYGQEVDPVNRFLEEDVFIPQPWGYEVLEGEVSRSLIVTYVGPEGDVEYDMHHIRTTMREFPQIYCEGDFQPGLIRELNGPTGDLEIVCVYLWDLKTGQGRH